MKGRDIITIGASAGGVEALRQLVAELPHDLPAALFIVLHIPAHSPSLLSSILAKRSRLPVMSPGDRTTIEHGHIYVAPPDHHLLVEADHMRVMRGPRENRHRPAIDPLFRSAAWSCGPRVVGVVLSGTMDDGTAGLWAVKTCGGTTVVQEPSDALFPCMPLSALNNLDIDHCLPLQDLPELLNSLARKPLETGVTHPMPEKIRIEAEAAMLERSIEDMDKIGTPSVYTCPACRGSLWEVEEGKLTRYRCHVGHSYMPGSLVADQSEQITAALYSALTAMEEKIAMLRRIAEQLGNDLPKEKKRYEEMADEQEKQAELLRRLIRG
ncbi:chemotaxis protein CheB [Geobacter sp. DSM 9736]|uniref:chemotaxis protein CheB n=1 Tax=Geobacter sp. DSM 9736 TaxID=1277350 RepID=UPI000B5079F9|nr:chemotaxis protein CheB [Geobacter sp. DSM 9736]SNB46053.1 two-component system, chemotaxis family, response regulator CheB [Geobacter sp. DSM 9736]